MSRPFSDNDAPEPVTVTDKRRIDPVTGAVRDPAAAAAGETPGPVGTAGDGDAAPAEVVVDDTADKVAELTADLQRVQADFTNYRRRSQRDQQAAAERGKAAVIGQLLGVLDDLDRARGHGDLDSGPLKSVADKLTGALTGLGLTPFGAEGDAFDPGRHEAVQHDGDGVHPVVGTVMRRGYLLGEQVLRHALVGVVDAPDEPTDDAAATPAGSVVEGE